MEKYDQERFILEASAIHCNRYDYSKVKFIKINSPVCIIDPEYGEFYQRPNCHLKGANHIKRAREIRIKNTKRYTLENFILKAKEIHGDLYDYSKVEYINSHTKITLIDSEYGEFQIAPYTHLAGSGHVKRGSAKSVSKRVLTNEQFIERAKKTHGDLYDYSKVEYINYETRILIIHPTLGEFWMTPNDHIAGCNHPNHPRKDWDDDHIIPISIVCSQKSIKQFDRERPLFKFLNSDINLRKLSPEKNREKGSKITINGKQILAESVRNNYEIIKTLCFKHLNFDVSEIIHEDEKYIKNYFGI